MPMDGIQGLSWDPYYLSLSLSLRSFSGISLIFGIAFRYAHKNTQVFLSWLSWCSNHSPFQSNEPFQRSPVSPAHSLHDSPKVIYFFIYIIKIQAQNFFPRKTKKPSLASHVWITTSRTVFQSLFLLTALRGFYLTLSEFHLWPVN